MRLCAWVSRSEDEKNNNEVSTVPTSWVGSTGSRLGVVRLRFEQLHSDLVEVANTKCHHVVTL